MKRFVALFLTVVLLAGFVSAASDPDASFDPKEHVADGKSTQGLSSTEQNELLSYIKDNINKEDFEHQENAHKITEEILKSKTDGKVTLNINKEADIDTLQIDSKDSLTVKLGEKEFAIDLSNLPKGVSGINVTKDSVVYTFKENQKLEMSEEHFEIEEKDGVLTIKDYKGIDGKIYDVQTAFSGDGRVTLKKDGLIEFSGGTKVVDSKTGTTFRLKDPQGAAGHVTFTEDGHIVNVNAGNSIIMEKEKEGITTKFVKNTGEGIFVSAKEDVKKSVSFPSGYDDKNSLLIDTKEKRIYPPKTKGNRAIVEGKGYTFDAPNTPSGGILLDGELGFDGTGIFGNTNPRTAPGAGDPNAGPGSTGGVGGNPGGGIPPNLGGGGNPQSANENNGILGKFLPFLLIGGGLLLAVLLLGGGDEEEKDERRGNASQSGRSADDLGYNSQEKSSTSTGKSTSGSTRPTIQKSSRI